MRGTDMRPASWRWLNPLRRRNERIEFARFRCPRPLPLIGMIAGIGSGATNSTSSSSKDKWQRRHRLLVVRN